MYADPLPKPTDLRLLGDLATSMVTGKRVLVSADVDVARRLVVGESHFKVSRLAKTLRYLVDHEATVLLLAAQGITSVRLLEQGNNQGLEWHVEALGREMPDVRFEYYDNVAAALGADVDAGKIVVLPNLSEVSQEDEQFKADAGSGTPSDWVMGACEKAALPRLLAEHFDTFVLDDFRSSIWALPSNVGLAHGKPCAIGAGLEEDLSSLHRLLARSQELASLGSRACFIGSSRPEDVTIGHRLLDAGVFDRLVFGPMPSLMILQELGYSIGDGPSVDLNNLMSGRPGTVTDARLAARRLAHDFRDRILLPTDFVVVNRSGAGLSRRLTPDSLDKLRNDERIMSIGPDSVKLFGAQSAESTLIFHFGMMGAGLRPHLGFTESVIANNLGSKAEVFMAGDHILEIAHDLGLAHRLVGQSTGAQTSSALLGGAAAPGLSPFIKA